MVLANARSVWRYFDGQRRTLALGVLLGVAQAVVLLPIGLLVRWIFDTGIAERDTGGIVARGAGIFALYVLGAAASLLARRLVLSATHAGALRIRVAVLERLHELPVAWHESRNAGQLHAQVVQEAERVEALGHPLATLGQTVIVGLPLAVLAVIVSPLLAAVVFVVVPALVAFGILMSRRVRTRVRAWLGVSSRYSSHVQLTLRSIALVRTRSADAAELTRGKRLSGELARVSLAKTWLQAVVGVVQGAVAAVAGSLVLIIGSVAVANDHLSLGDLLAFYAVIGLLLRTVAGGSGAGGQLIPSLESLGRLQAILDDPTPSPYAGTAPVRFDGAVALRGVTFGHANEAVLVDVDLAVGAGERVAVTGPNGAGKSTVVALLLGLHRPWSGSVEAAGAPFDDLDVTELRRGIGVVPQEPTLRPGTIAENISFGRPEATREDVLRAGELAGVDRFAAAQPDGYDTQLGEDGVGLSGGERQCVALARALVGGPPLLILDEPTNHLDAEASARLVEMLDDLEPAPAILLITHEPALAAWVDRVVTLADGRVVEDIQSRH